MANFRDFRDGVGGHICRQLGANISECKTWNDYSNFMLRWNNSGKEGIWPLVDAARRYDAIASTGERAVLHAVLHAADFSAQADDLASGSTWLLMSRTSGDYAKAIAAVAERSDA